MTERNDAIIRFLAANQWRYEHRQPLSEDASFRRYERLNENGRQEVLMDAPPDKEDVLPFCAIAQHLLKLGYSAPQVTAMDSAEGLLLLEDLGDDLFSKVIARDPMLEVELYEAAVDLLADLHKQPVPNLISLPDGHNFTVPDYDDQLLLSEAMLFVDWYLPELTGCATDPKDSQAFAELWMGLFKQISAAPKVLVLRDYHADNLMWLPQRQGLGRVGLLDFQDAVIGHPAYDLVSLLEDARRDVVPELAQAMIERYLDKVTEYNPELDREEFRKAYGILGAQRNTKIIGIFSRLWKRDGKPNYLGLIPRVWGLLEGDLQQAELALVRDWIDSRVPADKRSQVMAAAP